MKPINSTRIAELIAEQEAKAVPLHTLWFIDTQGEPCWSQVAQNAPLMTEMTIQPWANSNFKVVSFEEFPDDERLTIVRVEPCEPGHRGPFSIGPVSESCHSLEGDFPPRFPGQCE